MMKTFGLTQELPHLKVSRKSKSYFLAGGKVRATWASGSGKADKSADAARRRRDSIFMQNKRFLRRTQVPIISAKWTAKKAIPTP